MQEQLQVAKIMTEAVLSIDIDQPVSEVLRYFDSYPIHHLPVVRGPKAVGMLSSADVMKLEHFLPSHTAAGRAYADQRLSIASLLRGLPISIQPQQTIEEAAESMARNGIHALLVVDAQDNLVGIVTTTDIMHAALRPVPRADAAHGTDQRETTPIAISDAQFDRAIAAAKASRAADKDPDGVATTLLYLLQRLHELEEVLHAAERYVHAGQDEQLHAALLRAITHAKEQRAPGGAAASAPLGLGQM